MAKRFTDSDKWKKPFIRSMKAPYKLLWIYILDECDHAGIWQVDIEVAEIKIGERIKLDEALKSFQGKISIIENGEKWFINDFIFFQYGILNPQNRAHGSVLNILSKYGLIDENNKIKPLISPLQGAMDMDKDMVKVKDMDKDKDKAVVEKLETKPEFKNNLERKLHEFYQFRKALKKPIIEASKQRFLDSLTKLSSGNESVAIDILNQSIANGWQGIFELKTQTNGNQSTTFKSKNDIIAEQNAEHKRILTERIANALGKGNPGV